MISYLKYGSLMALAVFFMFLGVHVLVGAYRLNDPFSFMLSFFASNFIILISATLFLGFAIRLWRQRTAKISHPSESKPLPPP